MYTYYNRRPDGSEREDCVCRAISTATGLKYEAVERLLELVASQYKCVKLCVCCYHNLLDDILGYEVRYCEKGETVGDLSTKHKNNKLIIRIEGHLTCSMYGTVLDIWDCTKKEADCFWVVQ